MKADVHHFFASIDHDILKAKLVKKIADPQVYELMCTYIDSTDGLPLGYQTSQLLALMYLDDFDHWVKEKLHARYYGRYMDDFYIISDSKEYLQDCWAKIEAYIHDLKLELNEKTAIFPLKNGINFLGFHTYLDSKGGVIMKLRRDSRAHERPPAGMAQGLPGGPGGEGQDHRLLESMGRPRRPRRHLHPASKDRRAGHGDHRRSMHRPQEAQDL